MSLSKVNIGKSFFQSGKEKLQNKINEKIAGFENQKSSNTHIERLFIFKKQNITNPLILESFTRIFYRILQVGQ